MATPSERALLDTNVLVHAMNEDAEHHEACRLLRDRAVAGGIDACVSAQVLFEYFAVVTNPNHIAKPLAPAEALSDVEKLAAAFPMIAPPAELPSRVVALMRQTGFSGRHIFDVQLAATMLADGVTRIYTYDPRFAKIPGITALEP